jgi:preprotein translocase subunit YajC
MFWDSVAYAMGAGGQQAQGDGGSMWFQFLPLIFIIGIFYMLLIRPQQKREKQKKDLLNNLRKGDYVLAAGMYGHIMKIEEDIITLEIAKDTQVKVNRTYVIGLAEAPGKESKRDKEKDKEKDKEEE